jgi:predicted molibdopterin-dependent oxidoreductase YjgC
MKNKPTAANEITLYVNGHNVKAPAGEPLLTALGRIGIVVPTLCHDERLTPYGGCRICLVARRDGPAGLVPACSTPVQRNMVIETDSPDVLEARSQQLKLLILDHRMECPVCERSGDCRLQDLVYEYGVEEELLTLARPPRPRDLASPVIVRDPEKCVLCTRCVRLCEEVQGVAEIAVVRRGLEARVTSANERSLDCEFCGQCVNACPVGALFTRSYVHETPVWQREATTTTCSYCSCGCELTVESFDGTVQNVSSRVDGSPNRGKLCVKGWLGWDAVASPERLKRPMVRRNGTLVEVGWHEALAAVIEGLQQAQANGKSIAALASPRLTNEDAYLLQRLLRTVLDSPHIGTGPAPGVRALVEGVGPSFGVPRSTATFDDLAAAELVLVLGSDPTRTHPLVKTELVQGRFQRDQKLLLAVAVPGGLERHASQYLPLRPGTQDTLLMGLASAILGEGVVDTRSLARSPGFKEWKEGVSAYSPEIVSEITGLDADQIREAARYLGEAGRVVVVVATGTGVPGDEATTSQRACEILALLGKVDGPGCGILVLGEKANVQGVVDAGLHPNLLPGARDASSREDRAACQEVWDARVPADQGWEAAEILQAQARGEVGFLYLVGHDPGEMVGGASTGPGAQNGSTFVVVQDPFVTRAAPAADVVLPVALLLERTGRFTAADGLLRQLRRAVPPPAELPQDGQVFTEIARLCGTPIVKGPALRSEMRRLSGDPTRSPISPRFAVPEPPPVPEDLGRFVLDLSPQLFHSGSTTLHSATLRELAPPVSVHVSPRDAGELGIADGTMVRVAEGETRLLLQARVDGTLRQGTVAVSPSSLRERGFEMDPGHCKPRRVRLEIV